MHGDHEEFLKTACEVFPHELGDGEFCEISGKFLETMQLHGLWTMTLPLYLYPTTEPRAIRSTVLSIGEQFSFSIETNE